MGTFQAEELYAWSVIIFQSTWQASRAANMAEGLFRQVDRSFLSLRAMSSLNRFLGEHLRYSIRSPALFLWFGLRTA